MTSLLHKNKMVTRIIFSAIGAGIFTMIPFAISTYIDDFAPISWWVDVQSIQVSDFDFETGTQDITINRVVHRELNGYPRQELQLEVADGGYTRVYSTQIPQIPADYEPNDNHSIELGIEGDWWVQKGAVDAIKSHVKVGQTYRWVWVIEFVRPNGDHDIQRYASNDFSVI